MSENIFMLLMVEEDKLINIHGLVRSSPQGVAPVGSSCSVVRRSSSLALVAVTCSILAVNVSRVALSKA